MVYPERQLPLTLHSSPRFPIRHTPRPVRRPAIHRSNALGGVRQSPRPFLDRSRSPIPHAPPRSMPGREPRSPRRCHRSVRPPPKTAARFDILHRTQADGNRRIGPFHRRDRRTPTAAKARTRNPRFYLRKPTFYPRGRPSETTARSSFTPSATEIRTTHSRSAYRFVEERSVLHAFRVLRGTLFSVRRAHP